MPHVPLSSQPQCHPHRHARFEIALGFWRAERKDVFVSADPAGTYLLFLRHSDIQSDVWATPPIVCRQISSSGDEPTNRRRRDDAKTSCVVRSVRRGMNRRPTAATSTATRSCVGRSVRRGMNRRQLRCHWESFSMCRQISSSGDEPTAHASGVSSGHRSVGRSVRQGMNRHDRPISLYRFRMCRQISSSGDEPTGWAGR